jgi:hypothetical protein
MRSHCEKTESVTRAGVDRVHTLFMDAYRDLGAQTAPFDKSGEEMGTRFLGWMQDELVTPVHCDGPHVLCVSRDL